MLVRTLRRHIERARDSALPVQSLAAAGWPRVAGILAEEVKERLHFDDDDARAQVGRSAQRELRSTEFPRPAAASDHRSAVRVCDVRPGA